MRIFKNINDTVIDIQEKLYITSNKMNEYASKVEPNIFF